MTDNVIERTKLIDLFRKFMTIIPALCFLFSLSRFFRDNTKSNAKDLLAASGIYSDSQLLFI